MRVVRYHDIEAFYAAGERLLRRWEAEHSVPLGIVAQLRRDPSAYGGQPYLATVVQGDQVIAAAVRTPPRDLVVTRAADAAAWPSLAADVAAAMADLAGVNGPLDAAGAFAAAWTARTGAGSELRMAMRLYSADSVTVPSGVPGTLRDASDDDVPLVVAWMRAFDDEALGGEEDDRIVEAVERCRRSDGSGLVLWEHQGRPVSMAGWGGANLSDPRISAVYTAPAQRGRGYVSACVAAYRLS